MECRMIAKMSVNVHSHTHRQGLTVLVPWYEYFFMKILAHSDSEVDPIYITIFSIVTKF